ncbi:MAG TPA: hypothetical protein VFW31_16720 [Candidatus Angelobacter sp.]|nr:hypothetical protein [Candidatus Angelobacter sp.]
MVVTKYTIPAETMREIKKAAPIYGSQGRALQVATEMLIRMEHTPPPERPKGRSPRLVRVSMRLHKRTFELIRKLSEIKYKRRSSAGDQGVHESLAHEEDQNLIRNRRDRGSSPRSGN